MSLPAAALLARLGFVASIIVALATMVLGCLLVPAATMLDLYPGVLVALFVIASGVTLLQVAANPPGRRAGRARAISLPPHLLAGVQFAGHRDRPLSRRTIMLSGGLFGADLALDHSASRAEMLRSIDAQFLLVAACFAALALFIWAVRGRIGAASPPREQGMVSPWRAFTSGWALFGGLAIFPMSAPRSQSRV